MDELLTTSRAAALIGVSRATLLRAATAGRVTPAIVTPGGHLRFQGSQITHLRQQLTAPRRRARATSAGADAILRLGARLGRVAGVRAIAREAARCLDTDLGLAQGGLHLAWGNSDERSFSAQLAVECGRVLAAPPPRGILELAQADLRPRLLIDVSSAAVRQALACPASTSDPAPAAMLVPLVVAGRLVGGAALHSHRTRYGRRELRIATAVLGQVAIAIDLFHRGQERERERATLKAIAEMGAELEGRAAERDLVYRLAHSIAASAEVDYQKIVELVAAALGEDHLILGLHNPETGITTDAGRVGYPTDVLAELALDSISLSSKSIREAREVYVGRASQDPDNMAQLPGIESVLCIPLRVGGDVIGVLVAEREAVDAFSDRDRALLAAVADQCALSIFNGRLISDLRARALERDLLYNLSRTVTQTLEVDCQELLDLVAGALGERHMGLVVVDGDPANVQVLALVGYPDDVATNFPRDSRPSLIMRAMVEGRIIYESHASGSPVHLALLPNIESVLCLPFKVGDEVIGAMIAEREQPDAFSERELALLAAVADQCAIAIHNGRLYQASLHASKTDPLTGLHNRRSFEERTDNELGRARRFEHPLSVILLDVDGLKSVNDSLGHLAGDALLTQVAMVLAAEVRNFDTTCRLGGDEFTILLPETPAEQAHAIARRIRERVATIMISGLRSVAAVSTGIATFPLDGEDLPELLARADRRMYEMKRAPDPT